MMNLKFSFCLLSTRELRTNSGVDFFFFNEIGFQFSFCFTVQRSSSSFFFFLCLRCNEFIENSFQQLTCELIGSHKCPSLGGALIEPRYRSLWLPSFSDHFPSHVLGSCLAS